MSKRILILILISVLFLSSCSESLASVSMKEVHFVLGTVVSLDLRDHASQELVNQLKNHLDMIEQLMSVTIEGSDVFRLNHANGEEVQVDPETYKVLEKAIEYSLLTDERFDPTLGKLVELWGIGTDHARIPSPEEIQAAGATRGIEQLELLGNNRVRLHGDAHIDLGAIAKGYAADEMVRLVKEAGVRSAIFNLGGNVIVHGSKGRNPFRIAIQNPFSERDNYLGILDVRDMSIVTSGDYERYFTGDDGKRYHHILDPETGYPAVSGLAGVTVICANSTLADALSTALYIMGVEKGLPFIESLDHVEAIFITSTRDIHLTSGVRLIFSLTDDTFRIYE